MSKYTPKVVEEICKFLEDGMLQKDAAILSGISEDTFYTWKRMLLTDGVTPNPDYHSDFSESVEQAIAKYKKKLVGLVTVGSIRNGRIALEMLARRWPDEYGEKLTVGGGLQFEHKLTYDQALELLEHGTIKPKAVRKPEDSQGGPGRVLSAGPESGAVSIPKTGTSGDSQE